MPLRAIVGVASDESCRFQGPQLGRVVSLCQGHRAELAFVILRGREHSHPALISVRCRACERTNAYRSNHWVRARLAGKQYWHWPYACASLQIGARSKS